MTHQITTLEKLEQVSAEITAIETDRGIAWTTVHELEAKVTALKAAIRRHRDDARPNEVVDKELYAVLKEDYATARTPLDDLVDRFLACPLPQTVKADLCACDPQYQNRTGTNLLTAAEAKEMLSKVLEEGTI